MFEQRYLLFRWRGMAVYIHLTGVLGIVLMVWTVPTVMYSVLTTRLADPTYWGLGLAGGAGFAALLCLQGFAQVIPRRHSNSTARAVTLFPFGAVLQEIGRSSDAPSEWKATGTGPLTSLALAAGCAALIGVGNWAGWPLATLAFLTFLAGLGLAMGAFHLLPALPLAGGAILRSALCAWGGKDEKATRLTAHSGAGLGLGLFGLSLVLVVMGQLLAASWCLLIGLSLRHAAWATYHQRLGCRHLGERTVNQFMRSASTAVPYASSIRQYVDDYFDRYQCRTLPVVNDGRLMGTIHIHQAFRIPNDDWDKYHVSTFVNPRGCQPGVVSTTPMVDVLPLMFDSGTQALPVLEQGQIVGVLLRRDIVSHLQGERRPHRSLDAVLDQPGIRLGRRH